MGFTVKANGITVIHSAPGATLRQALNARDTFNCEVESADGSVRPQQDDDLTVLEDGEATDRFAGLIDRPTLGGYADDGLTAVVTNIQASDYKAFPARRAGNIFITSRSLFTMLQVFCDPPVTMLSPYGITLDPTQVNPGPTIPDMDLRDYPYLDKALDDIVGFCGEDYAWTIGPGKLLLVKQIGSDPAPFNVSDGDGNVWGDLKVEPNRQNYANHIIVRFNEAARAAYAFLSTSANPADGDTVVIGSTTYTFQAVLTDANGHVAIGATKEDSLANLVAAITLAGGAGTAYAASTTLNSSVTAYLGSAIVAVVKAQTAGASGNSIGVSTTSAGLLWYGEGSVPLSALELGADKSLVNVVEYPTTLPATPWDYVVQSDTTDYAVASALAVAVYNVRSVVPRLVRYSTWRTGLRPGQTQTVNSAIRFVNASFTIQEVTSVEQRDGRVLTSVVAAEGAIARGSWRDTYKLWSGKIGGTSNSVSGVVSTTGGGTSGGTKSAYFLGGDGAQWVRSVTPTWVPVMGPLDSGGNRGGAIEVVLDTTVLGTTTGKVTVRLRSRSGTVTARLRNLDDGTTAGTSAAITSVNLTTVTFLVTLATGSKAYRLELLPGSANVDVQGIGYIEF